ncbi:hypothetical protein OAB00_01125 [Akkermansiaceae bacterium]|nr:hypothetical protein [Akkermansiaceae bacterium]
MKPILFTISMIMFGLALRSTKKKWLRKLGIFLYMAASGMVAYYLTESVIIGITVGLIWLVFPLIELIFVVRNVEIPIANKLREEKLRCSEYFPESQLLHEYYENNGFSPTTQCGWDFGKSYEHYSYLWNADKRCLVAICHRVEPCTTFTYVKIISTKDQKKLWITTNFPFSKTLFFNSDVSYNHVTCSQKSCPQNLLQSHELMLQNDGIQEKNLEIIESDEVIEFVENTMFTQVDYNLKKKILTKTSDTHYTYSIKGILYLWAQILKDFFRLC